MNDSRVWKIVDGQGRPLGTWTAGDGLAEIHEDGSVTIFKDGLEVDVRSLRECGPEKNGG